MLVYFSVTVNFTVNSGFRCNNNFTAFLGYNYPTCDVFHWFCKIARFFATEPPLFVQEFIPGFSPKNQIFDKNLIAT